MTLAAQDAIIVGVMSTKKEPRLLLESADAGRMLPGANGKPVGAQRVRELANTGELPVRAFTLTGRRLFDPDDVLKLRAKRQAKLLARVRKGL